MIRALGLAAVLGVLAAAPAAAEPASPEERAAAIVRPAVVSVEVDWHGWVRDPRTGEVFGGPSGYETTSRCSGVVVAEDGYVATAAHCVDPGPAGGGGALVDLALTELTRFGRVGDPEQARAQLTTNAIVEGAAPGTPVLREVRVERVVGTSSQPERDVAPATVVGLLPAGDGDVAVLKIPRDRLAAVEVVDEDALPAGTPVLAVGYPAAAEEATDPGTEPSNKNGQISTTRAVSGSPYYEISAAASPGMSGGPVVDMSGRVVGLVSAAQGRDAAVQPGHGLLVDLEGAAGRGRRGGAERERPQLRRRPRPLLRRRLPGRGGVLRRRPRGDAGAPAGRRVPAPGRRPRQRRDRRAPAADHRLRGGGGRHGRRGYGPAARGPPDPHAAVRLPATRPGDLATRSRDRTGAADRARHDPTDQ